VPIESANCGRKLHIIRNFYLKFALDKNRATLQLYNLRPELAMALNFALKKFEVWVNVRYCLLRHIHLQQLGLYDFKLAVDPSAFATGFFEP